jgi:hypothetical protein
VTTMSATGPAPDSAPWPIGRITLGVKRTGKRRTGNPFAPFEVAGAGDGLTANLNGHEAGNGGYSQGEPAGHRASPRPTTLLHGHPPDSSGNGRAGAFRRSVAARRGWPWAGRGPVPPCKGRPGQVDGDALHGEFEARVLDGGPDAIAALAEGQVGQSDRGEGRKAGRHVSPPPIQRRPRCRGAWRTGPGRAWAESWVMAGPVNAAKEIHLLRRMIERRASSNTPLSHFV